MSTATPRIPPLPPITTLPSLPQEAHIQILDLLFERHASIHTLLLPHLHTPHPSYPALVSTIHTRLLSLLSSPSDLPVLEDILSSHPRLGAKKVDSAQSVAEQAALQTGAEEEAEQLKRLNEEYERTFPGLRFVVFVNGRGRQEIMEIMRTRIARGDVEMERREGVDAMCDIAKDRAAKLSA
ncbi:unnamed protein product [Zymoseptoria tritici ST99CH_1A5]|uniref:Oxo-4-hydroxy-4-carboxy-5-ureidoimidazoline decarboxylase domain-containing protein n=4 Tax=Zymoseptoria tritici TaxID=1047171 RepID=F9X1W5_ZYMTI|nr:uncharacterized protein MYCGRDRAFT_103418 [Zymoseptoria tritici IPO323]SMQ48046.1 unnamed protein product [Zymoseptoria tritici ST99CH_3D7]SMR46589.1 unnamed protein product [Zymoseptoria tritici ST99CH_1E4]SMR47831.1 unnamed protein product [Zymoseptoria tritici ST99CH_3D1]SMY21738.1 unnamed protein product [Zymoseptoria tritici ST99CH_1A5]EGP90107.1 hypothetical protein MYCGRDRAFT_103418 [Zymoseptoria tritici IPO323]